MRRDVARARPKAQVPTHRLPNGVVFLALADSCGIVEEARNKLDDPEFVAEVSVCPLGGTPHWGHAPLRARTIGGNKGMSAVMYALTQHTDLLPLQMLRLMDVIDTQHYMALVPRSDAEQPARELLEEQEMNR